LIRKKQFII